MCDFQCRYIMNTPVVHEQAKPFTTCRSQYAVYAGPILGIHCVSDNDTFDYIDLVSEVKAELHG